MKGVDISVHNGNVDFDALKRAGIGFVIIRCGYGNDDPSQDDQMFFANVAKCEKHKMPYGIYMYSYAKNTNMASSEARHTLRLLKSCNPTYGVWYDVEDPSQSNCDLIPICETYCQMIESAGYYVGIYSMLSWLTTKLSSPRLDRYDKWVAQWSGQCEYTKPYSIWQYTDNLVIGNKQFDGNILVRDFAKKEEPEMTQADFDKFMANYLARRANAAPSKWAEDALEYVETDCLMIGDSSGMHPRAFLTREELAQVLYNMNNRK